MQRIVEDKKRGKIRKSEQSQISPATGLHRIE